MYSGTFILECSSEQIPAGFSAYFYRERIWLDCDLARQTHSPAGLVCQHENRGEEVSEWKRNSRQRLIQAVPFVGERKWTQGAAYYSILKYNQTRVPHQKLEVSK